MSNDAGAQKDPLPPSQTDSPADQGAGSTDHNSSSDLSFPNQDSILSPNTHSPQSLPSSTLEPSISTEGEPVMELAVDQPALVQIELVKAEDDAHDTNEQSISLGPIPDVSTHSTNVANGTGEESRDWSVEHENEMKRVKVYELVGSRWMDQGTAFCCGNLSVDGTDAYLVARSEKNYQDVILSTTIRSNDVYQRQQDTLIVWTEPDGVDFALSFQDPDGCEEVWNFILEVQRHMNGSDEPGSIGLSPPSPEVGPESSSITAQSVIRAGHLPTPHLAILADIERAIKGLARNHQIKERICEYIQQEEYIKKIVEVLHIAEDMESLDSLHELCSLMQTILMLNDHSMYEHVVDDEIFPGVLGMLEYDPEFPTYKANYRDFLTQNSQFHQPISIQDATIRRKIHHTYRLQFLKDVVLARALDDATFSVLNACIIFNQTDIISHVQQDATFLRDIISLYVEQDVLTGGKKKARLNTAETSTSPKTNSMDVDEAVLRPTEPSSSSSDPPRPARFAYAAPEDLSDEEISLRRDVIVLIQQLCAMGKNVQLQARMGLFRTLVDRGVLFAVQWALGLPEKDEASRPMIGAAGEVLTALLDHDLNGVRGHVLKQTVAIDKEREAGKRGADKAETILATACGLLAASQDLAIQSQLGEALKSWLDLPPAGEPGPAMGAAAAGKLTIRKDDPGTERFMDYLYKDCIALLFRPVQELKEWKQFTEPVLSLTRAETNRFVYLCDLLYNFTLQHHFRSHFFIMTSNIMARLATLLKARDKHLRHAAFRFFRLLLKQNNPNMHVLIMKHGVLKPILDLTIRESRRDNLVSCSCQEYFEHMRRDNMKDMIKYCMTNHESEIRQLADSRLGGAQFRSFIQRWEMNNEPPPVETKDEKPLERSWPSQSRLLEREEEDYFNGDDDDDDSYIPSISQQLSRGNGASSPLPGNHVKRKRRGATSLTRGKPQSRTQPLSRLVDYEEEEEETSLFTLAAQNSTPSPASTSLLGTSKDPPPANHNGITTHSDVPSAVDPTAGTGAPTPSSAPPARPRPKRSRTDDDDEDDSLLRRMSKKPDLGTDKLAITPRGKPADEPPKKLKLKLAKSLPIKATSETGAKDGDIG